jgi:hypothetical protein
MDTGAMNDLEKALKYIAELEERNRLLGLELQATHKLEGEGVIMITSLVSHRNQRPRVDIQVGEIHTQMDAVHAIEVARNILECATGSWADAFIVHFLTHELGIDLNRTAQVLEQFRDYRQKLSDELRGPEGKEER